ncbi:MAG: tetratricopeptide repeat protein [Acidobacteria bacterium]|nr:tetratricopeptide repeat protein [Acidobacteriota bacterium]
MSSIAFLVLLQAATSIADQITFRMTGKVFVGQSEPAMVDVILKNSSGEVIQVKQSFANGSFWFDNLTFGTYSVAVHHPKYKLVEFPVLMREPRDTARTVVINLEPLGGGPAATAPAAAPAVPIPVGPDPDIESLSAIDYDDLIEVNPPDAVEEFRLGVEAIQKKTKDDSAEEHFKKAIAIAPEFYEAYLQLGLEQRRRGKTADSIATLEKARMVNESGARALSVLGRLYMDKEQFEKAADTLLKLGPLGPMTVEDRFNLGNAFYRVDKLAGAEAQLRQVIELDPKMPQAYLLLHNVLMKARNPVAGLAVLEDYLRLFPQARDYNELSERAKKLRDALKKQ